MSAHVIPIFDPQGTLRDVPEEQLAAAVKAGGTPAVKFQAPDKSIRFVPASRTHEAVAAGGTLVPFEQQDVKHPGFWNSLYGDLKGMATAAPAALRVFSSDPRDLAQSMGERGQQAAALVANSEKEKAAGYSPTYRAAAIPAQMIGVNVPGMENSAAEGDIGGVAGHAAAVPTAAALTEGASRGAGMVADVARDAISSAKPTLQTAGKAATAFGTSLDPDLVGIVSPRAGHALRVAQKVGKIASTLGEEAGPEAELDATGENKPYAGEPAPKAPPKFKNPGAPNPQIPAQIRQASGLYRGAQAAEEPAAALGQMPGTSETPPAQTPPPAAAAGESAPAASQPAPQSTAPSARSIVTDPATGQPEFSDVVAQKKDLRSRLSDLADEIQKNQKSSEARVPEADEDLTSLLQQSLDKVNAAKGGVFTSAKPSDLLNRWGVDESSFAEGRSQTRGMKPDETQSAISDMQKRYEQGQPVDPVMETRDADNNIIDVDGRGRALAAHRAGVDRIPVIVRRMSAPPVEPAMAELTQ
jgi:hypothetical protein